MDVDIVEEDTMSEPMDIDVGDTVGKQTDIDPPTEDFSSVANTTTLPVIPPHQQSFPARNTAISILFGRQKAWDF